MITGLRDALGLSRACTIDVVEYECFQATTSLGESWILIDEGHFVDMHMTASGTHMVP